MLGMLKRPAAIKCAGGVLSHDDRQIMPSSCAPSIAISMSLTMRSRLASMYPPPAPALMMKSLGAAVRISKGRPPASRTASLTTLAMPSRWLKQIASSDELFTTAIFGLSMSASLRPSAFHCARRTASRGEPGSKLLLNALGISVVISHEMLLTRDEHEMLDG